MIMQNESTIKKLKGLFDGPAWHGPSILEVLNKISNDHARNAFKNSHTLIEIIGHMTIWRKFVIEKLKGNDSFDVLEEENFPKLNDLKEAIEALNESQAELLKSISHYPESKLSDLVPGRSYSFKIMLNGIIHHDLYHLGQLSLLSR